MVPIALFTMNEIEEKINNSSYHYNIFYLYPEHKKTNNFILKRKLFNEFYSRIQIQLIRYNIVVTLCNLINTDNYCDIKDYYHLLAKDLLLNKDFALDKLQISDFLVIDLIPLKENIDRLTYRDIEYITMCSIYMKEVLGKTVILLLRSKELFQQVHGKTFLIDTLCNYLLTTYDGLVDILLQEHYKLLNLVNKNRYLLKTNIDE